MLDEIQNGLTEIKRMVAIRGITIIRDNGHNIDVEYSGCHGTIHLENLVEKFIKCNSAYKEQLINDVVHPFIV